LTPEIRRSDSITHSLHHLSHCRPSGIADFSEFDAKSYEVFCRSTNEVHREDSA
jgi:hypothetical protein